MWRGRQHAQETRDLGIIVALRFFLPVVLCQLVVRTPLLPRGLRVCHFLKIVSTNKSIAVFNTLFLGQSASKDWQSAAHCNLKEQRLTTHKLLQNIVECHNLLQISRGSRMNYSGGGGAGGGRPDLSASSMHQDKQKDPHMVLQTLLALGKPGSRGAAYEGSFMQSQGHGMGAMEHSMGSMRQGGLPSHPQNFGMGWAGPGGMASGMGGGMGLPGLSESLLSMHAPGFPGGMGVPGMGMGTASAAAAAFGHDGKRARTGDQGSYASSIAGEQMTMGMPMSRRPDHRFDQGFDGYSPSVHAHHGGAMMNTAASSDPRKQDEYIYHMQVLPRMSNVCTYTHTLAGTAANVECMYVYTHIYTIYKYVYIYVCIFMYVYCIYV